MLFRIRDHQMNALRLDRVAKGLVAQLRSEGNVASYDPGRNRISSSDAVERTYFYQLNAEGFIDGIRTPAGRSLALSSDRDGNLLELIEPSGQKTRLGYDQSGGLSSFGRNDVELCRFSWNAEHTQNDVSFWDGTTARGQFDAKGRPAVLSNRLGASHRFTFDENGRLTELTDGIGQATRFEYDENGRPLVTTYADGRVQRAGYDAAGLRVTDEKDLLAAEYAKGRPTALSFADGQKYGYAYDDQGRVLEAIGPETVSRFKYDEQGRILEEDNDGQIFKWSYDPTGMPTALEYPDGSRVSFRYDPDKRPSGIGDWKGGFTSFTYDTHDRHRGITTPNQLDTSIWLAPNGKPARLAVGPRLGQPLFETHFEYDLQARMTMRADSEFGRRDYVYDAESQLVGVRGTGGAWVETFSYDAAGNRTSCQAERVRIEPGNRLAAQGNVAFGYDERGNLTRASGDGQDWEFSYDLRNQLIQAVGPHGPIRYGYDALGRRVSKVSGAGQVRYVWCGEQLTREILTTRSGQEIRDYLYLPGTHTPFALRIDDQIYYYHTDAQGTPVRMTDAMGRIVWAADYRAFGLAQPKVASITNPLRFAGHYYDEETGLHYNRFRYYSPSLGRYLSVDPAGLEAGPNLYLYVGNDPVNRIDPLGLWWKAAVSVLAGAAVVAAVVLTAPVSLPVLAGAAVLGLAVGVGTHKALNIDQFCVSCAASAFVDGFWKGALLGVGVAAAVVALPAAAGAALAVTVAAAGAYAILGEHLGWPLPAGELFSPSTWHFESGPAFDEMTEDQKSESLGGLAGWTAGGIAGGAVGARGARGARGRGGRGSEGEGKGGTTDETLPPDERPTLPPEERPTVPPEERAPGEEAPGKYEEIEMTDFGKRWDARHPVQTYTPEQLEASRVVSDGNGKLVFAESGKPVNCQDGIYTMDKHGNHYVIEQPKPGETHHSTMLKRPAGAGGIKVDNGRVQEINENTGHFGENQKPGTVRDVAKELESKGVDLSEAEIKSWPDH